VAADSAFDVIDPLCPAEFTLVRRLGFLRLAAEVCFFFGLRDLLKRVPAMISVVALITPVVVRRRFRHLVTPLVLLSIYFEGLFGLRSGA